MFPSYLTASVVCNRLRSWKKTEIIWKLIARETTAVALKEMTFVAPIPSEVRILLSTTPFPSYLLSLI